MIEQQIKLVIIDEQLGSRKEQHYETTYEERIPRPKPPENIRHNGKGGAILPIRRFLGDGNVALIWLVVSLVPTVGAIILIGAIKAFAWAATLLN